MAKKNYKLDAIENRPDFIKKFVKSYGKTEDDILAADATETAASSRVAHQGWTISAGGNDNPNAMRETIIAMNIGSDIGTDDDAGLGIGAGGGGGPNVEYIFGAGNGYVPMGSATGSHPAALDIHNIVRNNVDGRSMYTGSPALTGQPQVITNPIQVGDQGYWISGTTLANVSAPGSMDLGTFGAQESTVENPFFDDGYNWTINGGTGSNIHPDAYGKSILNKIEVTALQHMGAYYEKFRFQRVDDASGESALVQNQWVNYWENYLKPRNNWIIWGFARIIS